MTRVDQGTPMMKPTIHLNGTSKQCLIDGYFDVVCALQAATGKVAEHAPNARDYYPQGPEAYTIARAEHQSRLDRLWAIEREITEILEAICE